MGGESSFKQKNGGGESSRSSGGETPRGRIIWQFLENTIIIDHREVL